MSKKIKSIYVRIEDLKKSVRALSNANRGFVETKDESYLLTLESQVRGLVAIGGEYSNPLLINLSNELGIPLIIYSLPKQKVSENITSLVTIGKTWSLVPRDGFIEYNLEQWMQTEIYFTDTTKQLKTRNQFIKNLSNSEGGTHYSEEVEHIVDTLNRVEISSCNNGTNAALLDIAEAVYWLGELLLIYNDKNQLESDCLLKPEIKKMKLVKLEAHIRRTKEENSKDTGVFPGLRIKTFK